MSVKLQIFEDLQQQQCKNKFIQFSIVNHVMEIILNRPGRSNAFSFGMFIELTNILNISQLDQNIKVIQIKANGKNFSTGNDLQGILEYDLHDDQIRNLWAINASKYLHQLCIALINCDKPIIASVHGAVTGFTFTMIALCDMVLATKDTIFSAPMVRSSQNIEMCGSYTFPRLFGAQKAFELLVLGYPLKANEAVTQGLVSQVFETKDNLWQESDKIAKEISQLNSECVTTAKNLMRQTVREVYKNNYTKKLLQMSEIECENLKNIWQKPDFKDKLLQYLVHLKKSKL